MKAHRPLFLSALVASGLLMTTLGACPGLTPLTEDNTDTDNNTDNTNAVDTNTSDLAVVTTDIPVRFSASLKAGDDLIVFGTGSLKGVSYVVPSLHPVSGIAIAGDYLSSGFAVAGKKVLLIKGESQLTVFDTAAFTPTDVPLDQVYLDSPPDRDDADILSPVIADGNLAVTRNNPDEVGGTALKLVDVSASTPVVTALKAVPHGLQISGRQVAIDATDHVVVTFADNRFFVYDLTKTGNDPREIDLSLKGGIHGPFAYAGGYIIYVASDALQNIRLLKLADESVNALTKNPGNRDQALALKNGRYAYFLERNTHDEYSDSATSSTTVYRSAIGVVPGVSATEGGVAGADPADSDRPWEGYGEDAAITPNGAYVFISGDEDINVLSELLQVSTSGGAFKHFVDGDGFLSASDVDASAKLAAFKIGQGENTKLGYMILP